MELIPDEAAHSASHVLHQEPGSLRGRHAHAAGEAHRARLELLRLLHGPGTSLLQLFISTVTFELANGCNISYALACTRPSCHINHIVKIVCFLNKQNNFSCYWFLWKRLLINPLRSRLYHNPQNTNADLGSYLFTSHSLYMNESCLMPVGFSMCRKSWRLCLRCYSSMRTHWSSMTSWMPSSPSMCLTLALEVKSLLHTHQACIQIGF